MSDYTVRKYEPKGTKYVPTIGNEYGDWTVIDDMIYKRSSNRAIYWKVRCQCGKEGTRMARHLTDGRTKGCWSCSHVRTEPIEKYYNQIKNRAQNTSYSFNISVDFIDNLIKDQNYKCKLSNLDIHLPKLNKDNNGKYECTASLDRINNDLGYTEENVQWLHKDVNMMKGKISQERFLELCNKIGSSKCG